MGAININSSEEDKYINLTKRLALIENLLTDYEMYTILNCSKFYANNFCDFLCHICWDYKIFENPGLTKEFLTKNLGENFVEFVFSSDFFKDKSKEELEKEEKGEKEIKDNYNYKKTIESENYLETEKEEKPDNKDKYNRNSSNFKIDLMKLKMVIFLFTNDSFILKESIDNYNDKVI